MSLNKIMYPNSFVKFEVIESHVENDKEIVDEIVNVYVLGGGMCSLLRTRVGKISCEDVYIDDFKIDFGEIDLQERINGLLGLDFLKYAKIVIDLAANKMITK